jgi:hypothetical protein
MVRRTDRPLRIVCVSFETTRFSAEHLIEAYARLVPRTRLVATPGKVERARIKSKTAKRRRGEA